MNILKTVPAQKETDSSPEELGSLPPAPTKAPASGSQDTPESTHEDRGKPGRPPNTQPKPKAQGPPTVQKDIFKEKPKAKAKAKAKANPKHDTEVDNNTD